MEINDPAAVSRALLAAAGLPASDEETAGFADAYPVLRAQADSLYLPFLEELAPGTGFEAAFEPVGEEANHG